AGHHRVLHSFPTRRSSDLGLPASAREVVNSVFLYYCTKAGLDLAIVNAERLERFASIPVEERRLAESLLFNTPPAEVPADHANRSEEHTSELQSPCNLVCR